MIHIIFYALGTHGDIDPMIALATELIQRGYRVSFLSNDYFSSVISASGCEFVSVGTQAQYHQGNSARAWKSDNYTDNFEYYHAPAFEPAFEFIQHLPANERSLVITLGNHNGAGAAAEKFSIPHIKIILSPNLIFSAYAAHAPLCWTIPTSVPKFILPSILRRHRKIKFLRFYKGPHAAQYMATRKRLQCPLKFQKQSKALLQIGFFPQWYSRQQRDWPANLKLVGFPLQNRPDLDARKQFDTFIKHLGAPIIFTTGTGVQEAFALCKEGRKICEALQVPGIFVGGNQGIEALQGATLCVHMRYIDFDYALPKALAVIQSLKLTTPQLTAKKRWAQIIAIIMEKILAQNGAGNTTGPPLLPV